MKEQMKLFFYSHISSPVSTYQDGERWRKVAEKTVMYLNRDLGESYPDAFYYLRAKIKGGFKYYAGSVDKPGTWDDSSFKQILEATDPTGEVDKKDKKRRIGN